MEIMNYPFCCSTGILFLSLIFCSCSPVQENDWINYTAYGKAHAIAEDGEYLWVGGAGLTRMHKPTGDMVIYTSANSQIPGNDIRTITFDNEGVMWLGAYHEGVAGYDGADWTIFHTGDSPLPHNAIQDIAIDAENNKWIGTTGGLAKYDGTNWTVYTTDPG